MWYIQYCQLCEHFDFIREAIHQRNCVQTETRYFRNLVLSLLILNIMTLQVPVNIESSLEIMNKKLIYRKETVQLLHNIEIRVLQ